MQRLALGLAVVLVCGVVTAEEAKPAWPTGTQVSTSPSDSGSAAKSPPAKPAAKAAAKKPKGPPAKELFGAETTPAPLEARAIGSYARGCLAGGVSLPINGPDWQVMRLSRNRNWGHPRLLDYLERLSSDARALDGWPGLLIGDMAQPRGGPMINGHSSHQIGLDADVWLTPMPDRILTPQEREDMMAASMLKDPFTVDPAKWTPLHTALIKRAASYPQVARIFVHPAIKKYLCDHVGKDRAWLAKVRPWWGHFYHFHIRLTCPPDAEGCENQKPVKDDDGCGEELTNWFKMLEKAEIAAGGRPEQPPKPGTPPPPSSKKQITLDDLPRECMTVLNSGGGAPVINPDGTVPAALKAASAKDAGPPAPHLDAEALAVLKAKLAGKGPKTTTAKDVADAAAAASAAAVKASAADAVAVRATAAATSPDDAMPLPDRKPGP